MKVNGIEGMNGQELALEMQRGGKFVVFQYTISILILTFRRGSDIYFVRSGESAAAKGLPYTLLSFLAGWWGIPWGPIYTIGSIFTNLSGGKDVTSEVAQILKAA
jgi:hypothetical protein